MIKIKLEKVSLHYPLLSNGDRRFKNKLIEIFAGSVINKKIKNNNVIALDEITLEINHGDRVAITGGNGSGKSTLLKLLAGIYPITSGNAKITGSVLSLLDLSMGIEQDATGIENIELLSSIYKDKLDCDVGEIIKRVHVFSELGDFINLPVKTYSTGMRMRLLFSFVLCLKSDILLMDEWLSVGDEKFNQKSLSAIDEMHKKFKIIIMATHSRDVVNKYSNREIHLINGKIENVKMI